MNNLAIYGQTQEMAMIIAQGNGHEPVNDGDYSVFNHLSKNQRVVGFFATAVIIQELVNQHEMVDVIDEVEEIMLAKFHGQASKEDLAREISKCQHAANIINNAMNDIEKQTNMIADALK